MQNGNRFEIAKFGQRIGWRSTPQRSGLTLLELLVVLVILAVVATVAVNSLQPQVETARFDQTRRMLENIQRSAVGNESLQQTDGTPLLAGFVADVGRLPKVQLLPGRVSPNQGTQDIAELWDTQSEIANSFPFGFRSGPRQPVDYSNIQLPCGWRGPYLHLPLGQESIRDPWGRAFLFQTGERQQVESVTWEPIPPYEQTMSADLTIGIVSVTGTLNFGQSLPSNVDVVLLVPDPDSSLTELGVMTDENPSPIAFAFSNVPIGLRALDIRYEERRLTKYVHVPHEGLSLAIDLSDFDNTTQ